jgi:hypothetical protein
MEHLSAPPEYHYRRALSTASASTGACQGADGEEQAGWGPHVALPSAGDLPLALAAMVMVPDAGAVIQLARSELTVDEGADDAGVDGGEEPGACLHTLPFSRLQRGTWAGVHALAMYVLQQSVLSTHDSQPQKLQMWQSMSPVALLQEVHPFDPGCAALLNVLHQPDMLLVAGLPCAEQPKQLRLLAIGCYVIKK